MKNRIAEAAAELAADVIGLIYPDSLYCICCGRMIDETRPYRLCDICVESIRWASTRVCARCGKPLSEQDPSEICFSCREHPHTFDRGYTCAAYGLYERELVFALKYRGRTDIAATLAEMMHDMMRARGAPFFDAAVPVPMHPDKRKRRGFNQAELISREFARLEGIEHVPELLQRVRDTEAMRGLTPAERRANILGAFAVPDGMTDYAAGRRILVIDDIYTTGSTADAAADALKRAGADDVSFLTFAAGADVVKDP
jgi:competence protein ComFC